MSAARIDWSVGVVIPAQNEQSTIVGCIDSILESHRHCEYGENLWIVVVADACTDRSADLARSALGDFGQVIECNVRSPGTARRLGAEAVLHRHAQHPHDRLWLANTDADTLVPVDWLSRHLDFARDGEAGVAGIVELEQFSMDSLKVGSMFREAYKVESDGSHAHVHGANFGVRADAYLDVGGWSHVTVAEDHCLWRRLKSAGWRLRSSASSVVITSARLQGRACGGFADTLRAQLGAQP
jgi:cellulose synthase/poly-beta-1,6-N-acetylglucosamine synthase-like glycosyltransferase